MAETKTIKKPNNTRINAAMGRYAQRLKIEKETGQQLINHRPFPPKHMDNPVSIRRQIVKLQDGLDAKLARREDIKRDVPQAYKLSKEYKYLTAYICKARKRIKRWQEALKAHMQ